jgi:drug/metabolite transporter (DMT)-like permease
MRGVLLFCAALATASVMDLLVKLGSENPGTIVLVMARSIGALVLVGPIMIARGGIKKLRPKRWGIVLGRGMILGTATALFFWSLGGLSLPVAYAITFSLPIILSVLAATILSEKVGALGWIAALLGFAGILLAIDLPATWSSHLESISLLHAIAAFAATVLYAIALLMIRAGGSGETTEALVIWGFIGTGVVAAILLGVETAFGRPPSWPTSGALMLMLGVAITGAVSQVLLTRAFQIAPASKLAPFEYTTFLWGVLFTVLVWRDWPEPITWAGAVVIIGATLLAGKATRS